MRNPLNEILTPSEQKALLFLALCFMIGTGLNLLGWKPSSPLLANQSLEDAPPESLATALKEDVPIIIDIRVATQAELEELPGIGAKRAQEIIAHRAKTPFNNVNEIMLIKGIGLKTYAKMRPMLLVFGNAEPIDKDAKSTATKSDSPVPKAAVQPKKADLTNVVNLNTASLDELCTLSGIGPAKAKAIIEFRDANGPFASIEDITKVKGIGPATLEKNRSRLKI